MYEEIYAHGIITGYKGEIRMKKFAALTLALVMCLGMASCGESGSGDASQGAKDDNAATTTTAADTPDTTETRPAETETQPVETEPAEPELEVESYELTNSTLGIKCSLDLPKFEGWSETKNTEDGFDTTKEYKYEFVAEDGSNSYCTVRVCLLVDSTSGLDWFIKQNEEIPNTEYTGYITGHSRSQDCPMNFYTVDYMDGKVRVDVNPSCMNENMPEDQYQLLLETIQKSLKVDVLEENGLYDSDDSLLTLDGLLKIPASAEIGGTKTDIKFRTRNRSVRAYTEFTADGNEIEISDGGKERSDVFEKFIENKAKDQPYDCEVNGLAAKGRLWNDMGTLTAEYIVKFDDETYYDFYVYSKGTLDLAAINEMMNGAERGDLEAQMNGYLSEFVAGITTR